MAASSDICEFGWKPEDAQLRGVDGKMHSILGHAGSGGLVVVFICNHCPYVKAITGRLVEVSAALERIGVGLVAINANDASAYPDDSYEKMIEFAAANNFSFPYLHDETQAVARKWGAVCTPDFFGFNSKLELQYRGRLDSARLETPDENTQRDLLEAMQQIAETGTGPDKQVPSMGCSIKWRSAA